MKKLIISLLAVAFLLSGCAGESETAKQNKIDKQRHADLVKFAAQNISSDAPCLDIGSMHFDSDMNQVLQYTIEAQDKYIGKTIAISAWDIDIVKKDGTPCIVYNGGERYELQCSPDIIKKLLDDPESRDKTYFMVIQVLDVGEQGYYLSVNGDKESDYTISTEPEPEFLVTGICQMIQEAPE